MCRRLNCSGRSGSLLHRVTLIKDDSLKSKQKNTIPRRLPPKLSHTTDTHISHLHFIKTIPSCYHPLSTNEKLAPGETGACVPTGTLVWKIFRNGRKECSCISITFIQHAHWALTQHLLLRQSCREFIILQIV